MLLETDVVVVGAGAAGIAAARLLTKHGLRCVILEGNDSIGGRIRTLRVPEWHLPIELGAEFVHGRPAPTVAFNDLRLVEVPERRMLADPTPHSLPDTWPRFAAAMRDARDSPAWRRWIDRAFADARPPRVSPHDAPFTPPVSVSAAAAGEP